MGGVTFCPTYPYMCNCLQESRDADPERYYQVSIKVRPAFYYVKSVTQFCPQSTLQASLWLDCPRAIKCGSQRWEIQTSKSIIQSIIGAQSNVPPKSIMNLSSDSKMNFATSQMLQGLLQIMSL